MRYDDGWLRIVWVTRCARRIKKSNPKSLIPAAPGAVGCGDFGRPSWVTSLGLIQGFAWTGRGYFPCHEKNRPRNETSGRHVQLNHNCFSKVDTARGCRLRTTE